MHYSWRCHVNERFYSYDGGTTWVKDLNQYKNVGNTTIKVRVTNANYDPNPVELVGTVKITPKAVTVTADSTSKVYGEKDPSFTATVTGTLEKDTVDYEFTREQGEDVGNYTITPVGAASQGNYTVTCKSGTLTIKASDREKAVEVASYNGVYDAKNHTIEVKNLVKGDHVQYSYDSGTTWEDTLNQYKDVTETTILVKVTNAKNADVFKQMIENFDKRMITSSELAHIIKTRKDIHVNVFTTSMGSGTRHTFEKLMEKEKYNLAKDTTLLFSEDSDLPTVNRDGSPYLLLDSKAYCMKKLYASDVKAGKAVNLTVVNEVAKS